MKKIKKEEKIVEVLKLQENILVELKKIEKNDPKYCNWRREIEEGMTTSGMVTINLPANEFDVGPDDNKNADTSPTFGADGTLDPSSDYWTMNNAPDAGNAGITISLEIDLSRVDSIASQIYFTNATIDPAHGMDIVIEGPVGSEEEPAPKPNLDPVKTGFSFLLKSLKIPMLVTSYQTPTTLGLNCPFFVTKIS